VDAPVAGWAGQPVGPPRPTFAVAQSRRLSGILRPRRSSDETAARDPQQKSGAAVFPKTVRARACKPSLAGRRRGVAGRAQSFATETISAT
jgi:hypothetical protein